MKETETMNTRTFTRLALVLLLAAVSTPPARAQENKTKDKSTVSHGNWSSNQETRTEPPRDGEEWFSRGYQMHSADRYSEAIEAFKRAADLGYRKATAMYNIACGYSLLNE